MKRQMADGYEEADGYEKKAGTGADTKIKRIDNH